MPKNLKNKKISDHSDSPDDVYDKLRDYIPLKYRKGFDAIIEEEIEDEDELEEYIFGEVADYMDEEICPDGYAFGVHEISQDIGIWKINEEDQKLNVPYKGMIDRTEDIIKVDAKIIDDEEKIPNEIKQANKYKPTSKEEMIREISKAIYRQKMEILKIINNI